MADAGKARYKEPEPGPSAAQQAVESVLSLFKIKKKPEEEKILENTIIRWVNAHPRMADAKFRVWYSIEYHAHLDNTPSISKLSELREKRREKILRRFAEHSISEIRESGAGVMGFVSRMRIDEKEMAYIFMLADKNSPVAILEKLKGIAGAGVEVPNGTFKTMVHMYVWSFLHFDRINPDSYLKLVGAEKPSAPVKSHLAKYAAERYLQLYESLDFPSITSEAERQDIIFSKFTLNDERPALFDPIATPAEKAMGGLIIEGRRAMYIAEGKVPKRIQGKERLAGLEFGAGFKYAYDFIILHPEYIDKDEFIVWDAKQRGVKRGSTLQQYIFEEKAERIMGFLEYKWARIANRYKNEIEFIPRLPEYEQRNAYLGLFMSPDGTASILKELRAYAEKGGELAGGMFKTVWDMYAWAHDNWQKVNAQAFKELTGRSKAKKKIDQAGLGIYAAKRYMELYGKTKPKEEEAAKQNDIYKAFTKTHLRTVIFEDMKMAPEPVVVPFAHSFKPDQTGRLLYSPYITVYYIPILDKFNSADADTSSLVMMQGSARVLAPPKKSNPIVSFNPDTSAFFWHSTPLTAAGVAPEPKRTLAVDKRFLGYYLYIDCKDPEIKGFYECVDTGGRINAQFYQNKLYVTGKEMFDIDVYAGEGDRQVWEQLGLQLEDAKRKGISIYLYPPNYFKRKNE